MIIVATSGHSDNYQLLYVVSNFVRIALTLSRPKWKKYLIAKYARQDR